MHLASVEDLRLRVPLRALLLRHRFISFFVITMLIQQLCITYAMLELPGRGKLMKLEMLGPICVACFLIWLQYGWQRVWATLVKLTRWRVPPIWYFHALFWLPLAAFLGVAARNFWIGEPVFDFPTYWSVIPDTGLLFFLATLALAVSEEIAWFGYAFALLYGRMNAFTAALITGFFWGLSYVPIWHAKIWIADGQPLWTVIVSCMAWGLVCAWIYNNVRSAFLLALVQIASNYSYSVFLVLPHLTGETLTVELVTVALLLMGLAAVAVYGPTHLSRHGTTWKGEWDREQPSAIPVAANQR